jgi:hypothetical protein
MKTERILDGSFEKSEKLSWRFVCRNYACKRQVYSSRGTTRPVLLHPAI